MVADGNEKLGLKISQSFRSTEPGVRFDNNFMNKYPTISCKHCGKDFETQIKIDPAIYAMYPNLKVGHNTFTCPHCDNRAEYREQDFRYTESQVKELATFGKIVDAFIKTVEASDTPLKTASEILSELEASKQEGNVTNLKKSKRFAAFKKWLPDSPEKVAAYIVIAQVVIQLLTKEPNKPVDHITVINQIDQTVIFQLEEKLEKKAPKESNKRVGRLQPCHCGSGKKYKHCHGKII